MEELIANRVNLNYEMELYGAPTPPAKVLNTLAKGFEFIYFFFGESIPLFSEIEYPQSYIKYLQTLGLNPKIVSSSNYKVCNWFGSLQDTDRERVLNSKLTSHQIAEKLNILLNKSRIVYTLDEFLGLPVQTYKQVIKSPFSMAGRDFHFQEPGKLPNNNLIDKIQRLLVNHPLIVEPFVDRVMDFGCLIDLKSRSIDLWELINKPDGTFYGGKIYQNQSDFLDRHSQIDIDIYKTIADEYIARGASNTIQVDGFLYRDCEQIKCHPLCEVNYRKSMGQFLLQLKRFLPKDGIGKWYICKRNTSFDFDSLKSHLQNQNILYCNNLKTGVIPLAPELGLKSHFYIVSKEEESVSDLEQKIIDIYQISSE